MQHRRGILAAAAAALVTIPDLGAAAPPTDAASLVTLGQLSLHTSGDGPVAQDLPPEVSAWVNTMGEELSQLLKVVLADPPANATASTSPQGPEHFDTNAVSTPADITVPASHMSRKHVDFNRSEVTIQELGQLAEAQRHRDEDSVAQYAAAEERRRLHREQELKKYAQHETSEQLLKREWTLNREAVTSNLQHEKDEEGRKSKQEHELQKRLEDAVKHDQKEEMHNAKSLAEEQRRIDSKLQEAHDEELARNQTEQRRAEMHLQKELAQATRRKEEERERQLKEQDHTERRRQDAENRRRKELAAREKHRSEERAQQYAVEDVRAAPKQDADSLSHLAEGLQNMAGGNPVEPAKASRPEREGPQSQQSLPGSLEADQGSSRAAAKQAVDFTKIFKESLTGQGAAAKRQAPDFVKIFKESFMEQVTKARKQSSEKAAAEPEPIASATANVPGGSPAAVVEAEPEATAAGDAAGSDPAAATPAAAAWPEPLQAAARQAGFKWPWHRRSHGRRSPAKRARREEPNWQKEEAAKAESPEAGDLEAEAEQLERAAEDLQRRAEDLEMRRQDREGTSKTRPWLLAEGYVARQRAAPPVLAHSLA